MNERNKKMIVPVIIVIVTVFYNLAIVFLSLIINIPNILKILTVTFSVIVSVVFIVQLVELKKEFKSEKYDDLGKY